jgi:beta-lactamase regulating signal transducer with metallopeptidase domain
MIVFIGKLTALLAAGFALEWLLRSRSAALRHLVWTATLTGAIALAGAAIVVPTLAIPVPGLSASATARFAPDTQIFDSGETSANIVTTPALGLVTTADDEPAPRAMTMRSALATVWLAGVAAVLAWWILGHAGVARLASRATPVTGDEWDELLAEIALASGVRRDVRLRSSAETGSPIVWGFFSPVILLPGDAPTWTAERRRAVLAHEIAHVARRDGVANSVACVAAALYWFHPLAWLGMHRMRIVSEHACDDRVLAHGTPGADYAAHILDVARSARALRLAGIVAIGMARPSHLEGRLLAVLDEHCSRDEPRRLTRLVLAIAFILGVPLLAAARAVPYAPSDRTLVVAAGTSSPGSQFERTLDAANGERLTLDLETGGSVTLRGWDEPRVRVEVRLAGRDWTETRVDIDRVADGVQVRAWSDSNRHVQTTSHSFDITVPRHYDLLLKSSGGGLSISDLEGSFEGMTGGGDLTLERVKGEADLQTGGGDVRVNDVNLRGSVTTGGGTVELSNVTGPLRGWSGSGPVIRRDAAGERASSGAKDHGSGTKASGRLHVERAGGDIELEEVTDGADLQTGGGDIRVARAHGDVSASTGGGDIDVGHVEGGVDASTGAGKVRVSVDDLDRDGRGVDIGTGRGDVVIELPADVAATFDLETAYTDNHRGKTRIESDWQLERSESDDWDDRAGTPRKYVRAHGDVAGGGPLIKVRAVNGNISIRRTGAAL